LRNQEEPVKQLETEAEYQVQTVRRSRPTATFSLPFQQIRWIEERAKAEQVSKTQIVERAIERAMQQEPEAA
jgi:hypothetical protein